MLALTAHAYNVVDLPENMTFSDALGVFNADEITRITGFGLLPRANIPTSQKTK